MISKVAKVTCIKKPVSISGYGLVEVHVHMYKLLSLMS